MCSVFNFEKNVNSFSEYVDSERSSLQNYKDIADYISARNAMSETIIANSPAAKFAFSEARHLSIMDSTVLIRGETGTGRDVLANYIYRNSKRFKHPFVPVNCSAISPELVESEFFGYEKGAFTGARNSGKPGLFEMANHGTLFLDEIGELPLAMQAKLLRVLETGEFIRAGGTKLQRIDVRIIAATNRNLKQMVDDGRFRDDLYYCLNVMPIFLPPLRNRVEDIIPLAELFLTKNNQKYETMRTLTQNMEKALLAYNWPGNIRELRNVIERYSISGRFELLNENLCPAGKRKLWETDNSQVVLPLHEACAQFEINYINEILQSCGGSVSKAAQQLGIHRSLLYKKIKKRGGEL